MTRFSDVDLSSLSTTASPLSAMVPASSLVAQSENFFSPLPFFPCVIHYTVDGDVCHSICLFTGGVIVVPGPSTALATLVWITGGTIPVTRASYWLDQNFQK